MPFNNNNRIFQSQKTTTTTTTNLPQKETTDRRWRPDCPPANFEKNKKTKINKMYGLRERKKPVQRTNHQFSHTRDYLWLISQISLRSNLERKEISIWNFSLFLRLKKVEKEREYGRKKNILSINFPCAYSCAPPCRQVKYISPVGFGRHRRSSCLNKRKSFSSSSSSSSLCLSWKVWIPFSSCWCLFCLWGYPQMGRGQKPAN
jgi:hypothetical protein